MPILLRVRKLQESLEAQTRRLLCLLQLRNGEVPINAGKGKLLLPLIIKEIAILESPDVLCSQSICHIVVKKARITDVFKKREYC